MIMLISAISTRLIAVVEPERIWSCVVDLSAAPVVGAPAITTALIVLAVVLPVVKPATA